MIHIRLTPFSSRWPRKVGNSFFFVSPALTFICFFFRLKPANCSHLNAKIVGTSRCSWCPTCPNTFAPPPISSPPFGHRKIYCCACVFICFYCLRSIFHFALLSLPFFILFICPRFMSHAGRQACRNIFARTHTHTPVGHIRSQKVSVYVSVMNMYVFIMKRVDGEAGRSFLQHRKCSTTLDWHMNYILIIQPDSVGVLTFAL